MRDLEARRTKSQQVFDPVQTAESVRPLRTFAVFSPRGGVGCSTIATNLAIELRAESGEKVLLVDGKLLVGHARNELKSDRTLQSLYLLGHDVDWQAFDRDYARKWVELPFNDCLPVI